MDCYQFTLTPQDSVSQICSNDLSVDSADEGNPGDSTSPCVSMLPDAPMTCIKPPSTSFLVVSGSNDTLAKAQDLVEKVPPVRLTVPTHITEQISEIQV
jgi:hypothetical protein